jgi:hypothetical protein
LHRLAEHTFPVSRFKGNCHNCYLLPLWLVNGQWWLAYLQSLFVAMPPGIARDDVSH